MIERLRGKGEIDAFGIEALYDLSVDPGGVLQKVPILGRVVPVINHDVQGISVQVVEVNARWKVRLVDRFVGMGLLFSVTAAG